MMDSFYLHDGPTEQWQTKDQCNPSNYAAKAGLNATVARDADISASKAFAWVSGSVTQDTWMPPGKTAVHFGFQHFRYVDTGPSISTKNARAVGDYVLYTMSSSQRTVFCNAIARQEEAYVSIHKLRAQIVRAQRDVMSNPTDRAAVNEFRDVIVARSIELYELDTTVAIMMAELFGSTELSITSSQRDDWIGLFNGDVEWFIDPTFKSKNLAECGSQNLWVRGMVGSVASELFAWTVGEKTWTEYLAEGKVANTFGFMQLRQETRQVGFNADRGLMADEFLSSLTVDGCTRVAKLARINFDRMKRYQTLHSKVQSFPFLRIHQA